MKKIVIALAVAAMAVASQAAQIKWATAGNLNGVDVADLTGNGVYAIGTGALKGNSTLNFVFEIYAAGTSDLIDSVNGPVKYNSTNKRVSTTATFNDDVKQGTTYDYIIKVTGTQNDLTGVIGDWDYTDATITTTIKGSVTTLASGVTTLTTDPTTWTVAGAVEAIPEPTSAMLLLLGMAGLALKRKQA